MSLLNAIQTRNITTPDTGDHLEDLAQALNELCEPLVRRFNEISPVMLGHLPSEPLPTGHREVLSFRSRVALLVEFYVVETLARFIREDEDERVLITFNTTNQFADFFFRDFSYEVRLRVDVKATHLESREASARFSTPIAEIREHDDFILYANWQWDSFNHEGQTVDAPRLLGALIIPAITVAKERDRRQLLSGGSFNESGAALAKGGNVDTNFGKVNRIVHSSRLNSPDLDPRLLSLATSSYLATSTEPELTSLNEMFVQPDNSDSTADE